MTRKQRFTCFTVVVLGILAVGGIVPAKESKHAAQKPSAAATAMQVKASSDYGEDQGYSRCFRQRPETTLSFEVHTDASADTVNFVLWNIQDMSNPVVAEPSEDLPVKSGYVKITVSGDTAARRRTNPPHLGPGPYMATLTASTSSAAEAKKKKTVGNSAYYYQTWNHSQNECDYH